MSDQRPTLPDPLEDGINAARLLLPRCWFDDAKCERGLEALTHYRKAFNERLPRLHAGHIHIEIGGDRSSGKVDSHYFVELPGAARQR